MKKPVLFIDGNYLAYKSYFKYQDFDKAVRIFLSTTWKLKQKSEAGIVTVAFDHERRENFRYSFPWYKKTRKGKKHRTDEVYLKLINELPNFVREKNMQARLSPFYEADDLIGIGAKFFGNKGHKVVIYTGDKDLLQLVDNNIEIWMPIVGHTREIDIHNYSNFEEKNDGWKPYQINELKGLMGDRSDSIPGIKALNIDISKKLLRKYKTVDGIYKNLEEIKKEDEKTSKILRDKKDIAYISLNVGTIITTKEKRE